MRRYGKNYNSAENKLKRSLSAQKAANARWAAHLAAQPERRDPLPCLVTLTAHNHATGKVTVVTLHPGTRSNNLRIDIDGTTWRTCGYVAATQKILHSLFSAARQP